MDIQYILAKKDINIKDVRSDDLVRLRTAVGTLLVKCNIKYKAANRMKERFEQQNSEWLNSEFHIPIIYTFFL